MWDPIEFHWTGNTSPESASPSQHERRDFLKSVHGSVTFRIKVSDSNRARYPLGKSITHIGFCVSHCAFRMLWLPPHSNSLILSAIWVRLKTWKWEMRNTETLSYFKIQPQLYTDLLYLAGVVANVVTPDPHTRVLCKSIPSTASACAACICQMGKAFAVSSLWHMSEGLNGTAVLHNRIVFSVHLLQFISHVTRLDDEVCLNRSFATESHRTVSLSAQSVTHISTQKRIQEVGSRTHWRLVRLRPEAPQTNVARAHGTHAECYSSPLIAGDHVCRFYTCIFCMYNIFSKYLDTKSLVLQKNVYVLLHVNATSNNNVGEGLCKKFT